MLSANPIINNNEEFKENHPIGKTFLQTDYYSTAWWFCSYSEYVYTTEHAIVGVEVKYIRRATKKEISSLRTK